MELGRQAFSVLRYWRLVAPAPSSPQCWVDWKRRHLSGLSVEEGAVMADLSIPEESCQHREGTRRKRLVNERLLPFEGLYSGATRQRVFACGDVDDLWIQLTHSPEPRCPASIPRVQWLSQDVLATRSVVAYIKPVRGALHRPRQRLIDDLSARAAIDTANDEIGCIVMRQPS